MRHQSKVLSHTLLRDEEPSGVWWNPAAFPRVERGPKRTEVHCAVVGVEAPEFNPRVAKAIFVAVHQEIPLYALGRVAVRLDTMRRELAIQKKGKLQRQNPGLSSSVVSAQEESAGLERKLFDSALKLMVDEISFSLNKSKEEVEELIFSKLES